MGQVLDQLIIVSGNIAGIMIVLYWLVDSAKNWTGTPELKILKGQIEKTDEELERLNRHIVTLIGELVAERR